MMNRHCKCLLFLNWKKKNLTKCYHGGAEQREGPVTRLTRRVTARHTHHRSQAADQWITTVKPHVVRISIPIITDRCIKTPEERLFCLYQHFVLQLIQRRLIYNMENDFVMVVNKRVD